MSSRARTAVATLACLWATVSPLAAQRMLHLPFGDSVAVLAAGRVAAPDGTSGFYVRFRAFAADSGEVRARALTLFRAYRSQVDAAGARLVVLEALPADPSAGERYRLVLEQRGDGRWYLRGEASPVDVF